MVSQGKMSISDPVTKYFPDFDQQATDTAHVWEWKPDSVFRGESGSFSSECICCYKNPFDVSKKMIQSEQMDSKARGGV